MDPVTAFDHEKRKAIERMAGDAEFRLLTRDWFLASCEHRYSYNFAWMGRPIIQLPQDILAMQQIIWQVKPDLIVETGIAHGGSLVFYAAMLELLHGDGVAVGIDIEIRPHNRTAIEQHPMAKRIRMIEGSSTDEAIVGHVRELAEGKQRVLVALDSNHTHDHVRRELETYSPLVTKGSYLVVFDTVVDDMPDHFFSDRPWGKGNSPKTAVLDFLQSTDRFAIDHEIEDKLAITVAPSGYLKCVKD